MIAIGAVCPLVAGTYHVPSARSRHARPTGRATATVGLVPTRRNRFGALDIVDSRPNLLRSSGTRP